MPTTPMRLAHDERNDLADLLETLTPQQWATASLCEGWTVRDVVAHVVSYEDVGGAELARRFGRGRFLLNRINAVSLQQQRVHEPDTTRTSGVRWTCPGTCPPTGSGLPCRSRTSPRRSEGCGTGEA